MAGEYKCLRCLPFIWVHSYQDSYSWFTFSNTNRGFAFFVTFYLKNFVYVCRASPYVRVTRRFALKIFKGINFVP